MSAGQECARRVADPDDPAATAVTPTLTKTRAVLDRDTDTPTHVRFAYEPDLAAGEAPTHTVYVERVAWRDMGEPDVITVTIEPGDHLNGPDA